jgi:cytochrome P450
MIKMTDFPEAAQATPFAANRLLFKWLSDDKARAALYAQLRKPGSDGILEFQSRADKKMRTSQDGPSEFHQNVYLIAKRDYILPALRGERYSNEPYQMLGSGTFMLGLAAANAAAQRALADAFLNIKPKEIQALANVAFLAAAALPLKNRNFDLADLAEQAAARFVGLLFGFEQADQVIIEQHMRAAYRGLNYVILGRHFVSKPGMVDEASRSMGVLLTRVAQLMDIYAGALGREQIDTRERLKLELDELRDFIDSEDQKPLENFVPILQAIGSKDSKIGAFSGAELGVIVVGLIAGTIGNIQASVCIAVDEFFNSKHGSEFLKKVQEAAQTSAKDDPDDYDRSEADLQAWTWEALRLNPPAAFLPRMATEDIHIPSGGKISSGEVVILAIGSGTRENGGEDFQLAPPAKPDALIFGEDGAHPCVGKELVMPVVAHFVRQVMALPGLQQTLDPETGDWRRLEKDWGFTCLTYPMEYSRFELLKQSPLIVIMQVRKPIAEHAQKLKAVIKYGAPRIEKKLRDSGHVHFAHFLFMDNDSKLALFTVYDRDFDAYIEYFALQVGPLFDRIFEHIEDPPPTPVNKFPKDFVEKIRRYNNPPAAGYFFSAYPEVNVSAITGRNPEEGP